MNLEFASLRQDALLKSELNLNILDNSLVFDNASKDFTVMFVGEAPGGNEVKEGRPFCGMAGKNLQALLDVANIKRQDYYITNAFGFRPLTDKNTNRAPNKTELLFGAYWLNQEIELLKPKIIVALGDKAANALEKVSLVGNDFKNLEKNHIMETKNGFCIAKTLHPSPLVYNMPQKKAILYSFFTKLGNFLGKK